MRSKIADKILAKAPEDLQIFAQLYADLVVRIIQILEEKNISQKTLAERLDKKPSEISRWLSGEHNFTLRSIAKLQAELKEQLLYVPVKRQFKQVKDFSTCMTVIRSTPVKRNVKYKTWNPSKTNRKELLANVG